MTDPTPLTYQQLNEIEARATAATPGPWEPYPGYGRTFYANITRGSMRGVGDLEFGDGDAAEADEKFVRHAQQDVTALLSYIRRLQEQRKYLIAQLAQRDAESGRSDEAVRQFLAEEQPAAEACARCKKSFDPTDTSFDGQAQHGTTPYCRRCVDACRDNEIADHRCVICA